MSFLEKVRRRNVTPAYVVLRHSCLYEWDIVRESKKGVTYETAETIVAYHVNIKGESPDEFMIIEVPTKNYDA